MDERRQTKGGKAQTSEPRGRTVSPVDVRAWFGNAARPQPTDAQCDDIARFLTSMPWPSDSPADLGIEETVDDDDRWWDFRGATGAAKLLLVSVPKMLA